MSDQRDLRPDVPPAPLATLPFGHAPAAHPSQPGADAAHTLAFEQASPDAVSTVCSLTPGIQANPDLVSTAASIPPRADPDLVSTAASIPPQAPKEVTFHSQPTLPPASVTSGRSTVLPRLDVAESAAPKLVSQVRPRYEPVRVLGKGGMGEVSLEVDHDIGRPVAIKRLLPQVAGDAGVARFVDEVRVMGRLEHPNIVPVHDVGLDEQGRYYFVMKHVEGDTLEQIIDRLRQGDADTVRRFSHEARIELFLGVLRALQFAHERGFVHRDVKPANIMVGRYGEVVLMDWGIAKPAAEKAAQTGPLAGLPQVAGAADLAWAGVETANDADQVRLSATRMGQLVGTPAYMSPEQAEGRNDLVDQRSDLYAATVVFQELVTLRHYLAGTKTLEEVIQGILEYKPNMTFGGHGGVPAELLHFVNRGMAREREARFQSAAEMIDSLQAILEGRVHVQCPATLTKRMVREAGRFVDRNPRAAFAGMVGGAAMLVFSLVEVVRLLAG